MDSSLTLYRAVATFADGEQEQLHRWRPTVRLPSNVPYVVDNLWEYLRPDDMPCRRHSAYASPSAALALANASADDRGKGFTAYRVEIFGSYRVAQLTVKDARQHPDIRRLQRLVQARQPAWTVLPLRSRQKIAMVFAPATSKAELLSVAAEEPELARFLAETQTLCTFWSDAKAMPTCTEGELFFELSPDASYRLVPTDPA